MLTLFESLRPFVSAVLVFSFAFIPTLSAQDNQTREERYIESLFERYDTNNDKKLSVEEMGRMRRPLKLTEKQVEQGFVTAREAALQLFPTYKQADKDRTEGNSSRYSRDSNRVSSTEKEKPITKVGSMVGGLISGSNPDLVDQLLGGQGTPARLQPRETYRVKANILVFEDLAVNETKEVMKKLSEFPSDELGLVLNSSFTDGNPMQDAYSLTTYAGKKSTFSSGKTIPVVTGSVTRGGTKQLSYDYQQVGTMASLDVVKDRDGLAVSLRFEKSYIQETEKNNDEIETIRPSLPQEIQISTTSACVLDGRTIDVVTSGDKVIFIVVAIELEK